MRENATMAWRDHRAARRVVLFDIPGDESAFQAFMTELSGQTLWDESTLGLPLGPYLGLRYQLDITIVPARRGVDPDDVYEVRWISGMRHVVGSGNVDGGLPRFPYDAEADPRL